MITFSPTGTLRNSAYISPPACSGSWGNIWMVRLLINGWIPTDPSQYYPPLWKRHPDKIGVRGSVPSISEARDTPPRFFRTWKNIREIGYCFNPSASPCKQWLIVMNALFQPFDQGIGIDAGFRKTEIQWEFIYISFLTNRSCGYRGYVALSSSDVYAPIYLLWFRLFKKERYFMETLSFTMEPEVSTESQVDAKFSFQPLHEALLRMARRQFRI